MVGTIRSTVHIESIATGGAGVGHLPDGRAVFVQRTAPGDEALIEVVREKRRWAQGRLLRVLQPGPGRRIAPCVHYAVCGGCTLEHLEYSRQLDIKAGIVREALRRIGGLVLESPPVVAAPLEFRYRNRVSFTLLRTPRGRVVAGFHQVDRVDRIVDITGQCLLPELPIAEAWDRLRECWGPQAALLPSGERLRITLRGTVQGKVLLLIDGGFSAGQPERLLQAVPGLHSAWQRPEGAPSYRLLAGQAEAEEQWQEEEITLSGTVFLQVNRAAAELLEQHVLARVQASDAQTVLDAYCGVGLHARRLARLGYRVTGIESDTDAVESARRAGLAGARFVQDRVENVIGEHLPADLVILNPPRSGLHVQVIEQLRRQPPARILYVSCDPATLARDLALLKTGFAVQDVRCFDLFPQTAQIETVVELACVTS